MSPSVLRRSLKHRGSRELLPPPNEPFHPPWGIRVAFISPYLEPWMIPLLRFCWPSGPIGFQFFGVKNPRLLVGFLYAADISESHLFN